MGSAVQRLLQAGLAPATHRAYLAGKKKYLLFCMQSGTTPLPVTEEGLLHFTAFVANQGLKHTTIKGYLSAIRHLQVCSGNGDPGMGDMPRLALALRGVKKEQASQPKRARLPITPAILQEIRQVWSKEPSKWDYVMLWAACCLGFFGFLRSGEFTAPEDGEFDPGQHLSFSDVAADSLVDPRVLSIKIKQSKTDPFRLGVTIFVGKTDSSLCPVSAVLAYMARRGPGEGPLFRFQSGLPLSRSRLVEALREVLGIAGYNPEEYAGHSFRIGAATTAAACGIPIDTIKTLGRWKSDAYRLYVRLPREHLAEISKALVIRTEK